MLWFLALLVLCYAPVLNRLVMVWNSDEDMGHGFFVPPLAAYIAWQSRHELFAEPFRTNWWGLALVVYAALQLGIATLGAEVFLARTAFVLSIAGCILFAGGTRALRILAFPIVLLFFMVPIPSIIYNRITLPLQFFASSVAETILNLLGTPVLRQGNVLELPSQTLSVVEACSGIRSLLSLSFLSLVYGWFFERRTWVRWALFLATVPIAIIANSGRVTITGVMSEINPELAQGFFHTASGWVIFMIALVILVVFHQVLHLMIRIGGHRHAG
ncbi:MAG TPA: exosortase [Bryobacteraceae bacterium]|nr:exosortase [Bryobacteraceae bacterium]